MKKTRVPHITYETNVVTKRGTGASVTVSATFLGKQVKVEYADAPRALMEGEVAFVIREVKRQRKKGGAHVWVPKEWIGCKVKITPIS